MSFKTNHKTRKAFPVKKSLPEEDDEKEYMMFSEEKEDKEFDFIDDDYPKDKTGDI